MARWHVFFIIKTCNQLLNNNSVILVEYVDQRDYLRGVNMIILYSPIFLAYSALPAAQFNQRASLNYSLWVGNEMTQLIVLPSSTLLADFVLGLWPPNPE